MIREAKVVWLFLSLTPFPWANALGVVVTAAVGACVTDVAAFADPIKQKASILLLDRP